MSFLQSLVLGVVQGLTEFLPISSTAHLILVPWLLGWEFDPKVAFVFDVLLQLGTVAAVVAYFRRDLADIARATLTGLIERGRNFDRGDEREERERSVVVGIEDGPGKRNPGWSAPRRCGDIGTGGSMDVEAHEDWEIDGSCRVIQRGTIQEEELGRCWECF